MTLRRPAPIPLAIGLLVIAAARVIVPTAPPLYDGIVPVEPYVWLDPPPGKPGGAEGATAEFPIRGGVSPFVAVTTQEPEPQAQLFAEPGALTVPSGTRAIEVSIQPVRTTGLPTDGHIDGNVYRISVTNDRAAPITAPATTQVSIVLRASDPAQLEASIARFAHGSWQPLETSPSGFGGTFIAVVTEFGDFAVVAPGPGPTASTRAAPTGSASTSVAPGSAAPSAEAPASSPADGSAAVPDWLLASAAVVVAGLALLGYRIATRRRHRYRGAHPMRRR